MTFLVEGHAVDNPRHRLGSFLPGGLRSTLPVRCGLNGGDKAITPSRERFNENRSFGRFSQYVAHSVDSSIKIVIEIDESICWPKFATQLLSCDDLSGPLPLTRPLPLGYDNF